MCLFIYSIICWLLHRRLLSEAVRDKNLYTTYTYIYIYTYIYTYIYIYTYTYRYTYRYIHTYI